MKRLWKSRGTPAQPLRQNIAQSRPFPAVTGRPARYKHRFWLFRPFTQRIHGPDSYSRRRAPEGRNSHQRRQECGAEADGGVAADRRAADPDQCAAAGRCARHGRTAEQLRRHDCTSRAARSLGEGDTIRLQAAHDHLVLRAPTTWCARCARASRCWGRCWRGTARPRFRCRAAAPSARGRSICISKALEAMGAKVELADGYVVAGAKDGLKGAEIDFPVRLGRRDRDRADGRDPGAAAQPSSPMPRASRRSRISAAA